MIRGDGFIYFDDWRVTVRYAAALERQREHWRIYGNGVSLALTWLEGTTDYEAIDEHVNTRYMHQLGVIPRE